MLYSTLSNTDTLMASPPKGTIPAYGSSRSTGGVFRGRALGNAINIGDAAEVWEEMDIFREGLGQKQVKGKIHFYISTSIHLMSTSPSPFSSPTSLISANVKPFKMLLVVDLETIHPFDVSLVVELETIHRFDASLLSFLVNIY